VQHRCGGVAHGGHGPLLGRVLADALQQFQAGAVAPVALVEDGPNGGQAKAGLLGDCAQRFAGCAQLDDGLPLGVAGGQWPADVAPTHHVGVEVCDVAIPFVNEVDVSVVPLVAGDGCLVPDPDAIGSQLHLKGGLPCFDRLGTGPDVLILALDKIARLVQIGFEFLKAALFLLERVLKFGDAFLRRHSVCILLQFQHTSM
jgi:hypothetical protein